MRNREQFPAKKETVAGPQSDGANILDTAFTDSDENFLDAYFARNYTKYYNLALRYARNRHMAEDIVQELFCKACIHFHKITDPQHFDRWLAVTTFTTAVDVERKNRGLIFLEDCQPMGANLPSDIYLPEPTLLQKEERKIMQDQVESLEPIYSDIIRLKFFGDLSYHEIATLKGIKDTTLRSQCHRALKLLLAKGSRIKE